MIRLPLEAHADTRHADIGIEVSNDPGTVLIVLDPMDTETFDDRQVERVLLPAEARALAAMLRHFAYMAER